MGLIGVVLLWLRCRWKSCDGVVGRFSDMAVLGVLAVVLDHAPLCVGNVVGSNEVVLSEWCVG
jgi:hypothetical protein